MAVVAHLIILVSDRILALTRLMAVASALALALILGHLVSLNDSGLHPRLWELGDSIPASLGGKGPS